MRPLSWLFALIPVSSCASDPVSVDLPTVLGPERVVLDDQTGGLDIEVTGGTASGWRFGAIEPRLGIDSEGCRGGDEVCHTLGPDGGRLGWGGTCSAPQDGETCIEQLYWRQGVMTYVLRPAVGSGCWAWGDGADVLYPECEETDWPRSSN
ncbi:MAG: hypothetical protein R3F61_13745 [Myxococcota bacterium]